jgi:hypothetical protein
VHRRSGAIYVWPIVEGATQAMREGTFEAVKPWWKERVERWLHQRGQQPP